MLVLGLGLLFAGLFRFSILCVSVSAETVLFFLSSFAFDVLGLVSSVLCRILAERNVCETTYSVSSGR